MNKLMGILFFIAVILSIFFGMTIFDVADKIKNEGLKSIAQFIWEGEKSPQKRVPIKGSIMKRIEKNRNEAKKRPPELAAEPKFKEEKLLPGIKYAEPAKQDKYKSTTKY